MAIKPITPDEVKPVKPDVVIHIFNKLIQENWDGISSVIKQRQAMEIIEKETGLSPDSIIGNGYLDIEEVYRQAGWKVVYDKPGFNETPYPATFTFTKKKEP